MQTDVSDVGADRRLADILARVESSLADDLLPVEIFNDVDVFQAEIERIFARTWVFVAHESEISKPGDFVQRRIGLDPVIVTRDGDGGINVLSNYCRHRGTQVCQTDQGNSRFFKCAYHGWTYANNGELIGTPFMQAAYGTPLDKRQWGLLRAPRVESRSGFIFASLSEDIESLDEFLGGAGWMLDALVGMHPDGMRVAGPPDRYHVKANWKTAAENFSGDTYHVPSLHGSMGEIGLAFGLDAGGEFGRPYEFENGHAFLGIAWTEQDPQLEFWGYPPEIKDSFDLSGFDESQTRVVTHDGPIVGTVFPNLSFFRAAAFDGSGLMSVVTSFRQWQPVGPGELEVWSWQFVWNFQDEDSALQDATIGQLQFGVAGVAEQDDTVAWEGAPKAGASAWARKEQMNFHFQQGNFSAIDQSPDPAWQGPGIRRRTGFGEHNQLHFYRHWLHEMQEQRPLNGPTS
ncbi:aromatic ring-hydroxylating dioxygenase subunit alpha [Rhodococcus sp. USK13]|uniref:aromatic ring-hydroxylating oxygenase subunit alpha n=1 Tax=Rhodococcus sp. USK13 TaxID=2806442 RepID=UPI001BCF6F75|nr:aromatic ring-hydroxylating dioxygenase subunit alpha [Rhodococcus sp. USK13]